MPEPTDPSRPDPTPWGAEIAAACRRAGRSARAAARQAGISEGRWRQITSGYQVVSPGVYAPVRGPAHTVARMAAVAGLTPAQLRTAGRDDAARLLAAHGGEGGPAGSGGARGSGGAGGSELDELLMRRIRRMDGDKARELLAVIVAALFDSVAGEADAGPGAAHDDDLADEPGYGT
jgi:hypothetical protein